MKTIIPRVSGKNFPAALLVLFSLFSASLAQAQLVTVASTESSMGSVNISNLPFELWATVKPIPLPSRLRVLIANPVRSQVQIVLRNKFGEEVYRKALKAQQYHGEFDLSSLEDGTYTFEVSSARQTFSQAFSLKTSVTRKVSIPEPAQPTGTLAYQANR